jgi:hypothetical protein
MADESGKEQLPEQNRQDWYEIEVAGHFNPGWFDWLEGWEITTLPSGNTLLSGRVIDQPALHGIFACIRDLNLKIISLNTSAWATSDKTQGIKKQD